MIDKKDEFGQQVMVYCGHMGRIYNKDARLESHKFFPYIAWVTVFLFAFFVYTLVTDLQAVAGELAQKNHDLKSKTSVDAGEIEDFGY